MRIARYLKNDDEAALLYWTFRAYYNHCEMMRYAPGSRENRKDTDLDRMLRIASRFLDEAVNESGIDFNEEEMGFLKADLGKLCEELYVLVIPNQVANNTDYTQHSGRWRRASQHLLSHWWIGCTRGRQNHHTAIRAD
jgi:hypothetical protein